MTKSERSNYSSLDFAEWNQTNTLVLTPKFQRRGVWTDGARSLLIDTLLRGMPVPPIYLRARQSDDRQRIVREVVDGQQRIASILKYLRNELKLSKSLNTDWANKRFSELTSKCQDQIRQYSFNCEVFRAISDQEVLEIFTRLNTYSIPLNQQELRNGKYFGYFKQSAYALAHDYLEFWRRHRIFSERAIARMLEVELTSELMIAEMSGLQDKKKSIDSFYEKYDERFPNQRGIESRFSLTLNRIEEAIGDILNDSEFVRAPLFYSLFCAVFHKIYGLPGITPPNRRRSFSMADRGGLSAAVAKLSQLISDAKEDQRVPRRYAKFVNACLRQTDNIEPRRIRFHTIYSEAF